MANGRRYVTVTNGSGNDTLLTEKDEQIDWLKQRVETLEEELSEVRQRSDTIVMQLSRQFEQQKLLLEDTRPEKNNRRWWTLFQWWKEPTRIKSR
jgi:hypothetical protein